VEWFHEQVEADALISLLLAAPEAERRARGVVVEEVGGALLMALPGAGLPRVFNRVMLLGTREPASDERLDAVCAAMARHQLPWQISLWPGARPAGIAERLAGRGFTPGYAWAHLARGAEPPAPATTDLDIRRLAPDHAEEMAALVAPAQGTPDYMAPWFRAVLADPAWAIYGGFDGGRLGAVGAAWIGPPAAWFGLAASHPDLRGRGGQSAILAARIGEAVARGATTLVVETGVPAEGKPNVSWRNLHRAGFAVNYVRDNWVAPATGDPR